MVSSYEQDWNATMAISLIEEKVHQKTETK